MDTAHKISIIIPTYNRVGLLAETIDCIRKQTYPNWELLIMDDGSTDTTEQMIRSFKDDRIVHNRYEHTGSVSKLFNDGIKQSGGELIAFMASDDLWPAEKLAKQLDALLSHPEAGFSLTNGYNFRGNRDKPLEMFYERTSGIECGNVFERLCKGRISGFLQTAMLWRYCINTTGLLSEKRSISEVSFLADLAYNFKMVLLYEPLLMRRLHDSNISGGVPKDENSDDYFEMLKTFKHERKLLASVANHAIFTAYVNIGETNLQFKKRGRAIVKFIRAWKYKPLSIVPFKKIAKAFVSLLK